MSGTYEERPVVLINPGFDMFRTQKGTQFHFRPPFVIPANFFDRGSAPFTNQVVEFTGVPLGTFNGINVGTADTIVRRTRPANLPDPLPSNDTIPIRIERLSLRSLHPIRVRVGSSIQLWRVE